MEELHIGKRKWVKYAAIIFFVIIILLTFFSNTIMNYTLAQVSTQSIESDSVASKVRGTGTVEAEDSKEVVVNESREVESILVNQGDSVKKGDVLVKFKPGESSEITEAKKALQALNDAYYNGILVNEIDSAIVTKAEKGGESYDIKRAKLSTLSNSIEVAQKKVDDIQKEIDILNKETVDIGEDENIIGNEKKIILIIVF